jgi:cytoskeletal protein RodZ
VIGLFRGLPRVRGHGYQTQVPSVAEQLKAERERQGRTVHDVANVTNIKTDHIRALESGDWDAFGAQVYIRGFTRTYSKELRLDVPRIMAELEAELGQTEDYSAPPPLTGRRKGPLDFITLWLSRVRWQWLFPILIGGAVLVAGWMGYRSWAASRLSGPVGTTPARSALAPTPVGNALRPLPKKPLNAQAPLPTNATTPPARSR